MKNKLFIICAVVIIAVGVFALASHKKPQPAQTATVKIGAALALTGDASSWGEVEKNGINLAVSEINAKGGINGKKVEIVSEDTTSTSNGGLSAVQKLTSVDNVKYVIGPTWLDSYPGAQGTMKGRDAVMITPSASVTAIQQGTAIPNVFSTWYRTDALTGGLEQTIKVHGKKKIALVFQNDAYYEEFISFFKSAAAKDGVTIVSTDMINPGQSDFKTVFAKLKNEGADGVVFGMYDEKMVDSFLKNHALIASSLPLYSNDAVRGYFGNAGYVKLLEGTSFVENAAPNARFTETYTKTYGTAPTLSASTAYDTVHVLAKAIANGASDVPAYLKSNTFDTVSFGKVSFDSVGGIATENRQYQVHTITNGKIN